MNDKTGRLRHIVAGAGMLLLLASCGEKSTIQRNLESGESYYEAGRFDEAKLEFLNLHRRDPKNAVAHARLGEISLRQGSYLPAVSYLLEARTLDPDNEDVRLHLAEVSLVLGARADARKHALEVLETAPAHDRALLILAESATPGDLHAETEAYLRKPEFEDSPGAMLGLASLSYQERDYEAAELGIRRALEKAPRNPKAHLALAIALMSQNKTEEAAGMYRKAAELAPPRSSEKIAYAQFLIQAGRPDDAREHLLGLTDSVPDYLPAWNTLAGMAFREKDHAKVEELLGNVFQRDPVQHEARLLLARIQMARGESQVVLENLKELESLYQRDPVIQHHLAIAYLMNAIPSNAIAALDRALELNFDYLDARILKAKLHLRLGEPELAVESMQAYLKRVRDSREELLRQPEEAKPELHRLAHEIARAQPILADAYRMLGRLEEAGDLFRRQIEEEPEDFQAHLLLGIILRQQNRGAEARAVFEKAGAIDGENPLPVFQLADLDVLDGDSTRALARVREIAKNDPESAAPFFMIGRIYAHQKSWDAAEEFLLKAIDLQPELIRAYDLLVATYVEAEKLSEAEAGLVEMVERRPEDASALIRLALVREELGLLGEAESSYKRVLELIPDFAPALNNLAWLYVEKLDDPGRAFEIARRARLLRPEDGSIADTLGWIYYQRQDYARAIALLREGVAKLPGEPQVHWHLGLAASKMGQVEEARAAFQKAVDSNLDFAGREEARQQLERLPVVGAAGASLAELQARVKEDPDDVPTLLRLAAVLEQQGQARSAADVYEKVRVINPKQIESVVSLARLHHGPLKDDGRATEFAKEARVLDPGDGRPLAILGSLELSAGNPRHAFSLLSLSLFLETRRDDSRISNPQVVRDLGWAAYQIGDLEVARKSMGRVAETGAEKELVREARAFLALTEPGVELTPEVLAMAESVLHSDPDHVPARMITAAKIAADGEWGRAESIYTAILSRWTDFTPAMKDLAGTYLRSGAHLEKARELILEVRRAHPEDVEASRLSGEIGFRLKDYPYAILLLEEVDGRGALDGEGLFYLGSALIALDPDSQEGRATLRRAIAQGVPKALEIEARAMLGSAQD